MIPRALIKSTTAVVILAAVSALLLSCRTDLSEQDLPKWESALLIGDTDELRRLVKKSPALARIPQSMSGSRALHVFAAHDDADGIKLCLDAGADVNSADEWGRTPLFFAVGNGMPETMELLISRGADLRIRDVAGVTPLMWAPACEKDDAVDVLLKHISAPDIFEEIALGRRERVAAHLKSDPQAAESTPGPKDPRTPLHFAVLFKRYDVIELLLARGARVAVCDPAGMSPLHTAVFIDALPAIEILVRSGADLDQICLDGRGGLTPLAVAISSSQQECAKLLLELGANPEVGGRSGMSPLHFAAMKEDPVWVELLLAQGVDPNLQDSVGNTPLHSAVDATTPSAATMKALIASGANVTARNKAGKTPAETLHEVLQADLDRADDEDLDAYDEKWNKARQEILKFLQEHTDEP